MAPKKFQGPPNRKTELLQIMKKLKQKTSTGLDGISSEVLKMGAQVLCAPLTLIINVSIISGKFPKAWKQSKCVPLHKKGNKRTLENFRPVSLLSVSGMILEKVVADQIEDFFETNELFGSYQFGFRQKSCVSELLELFDNILEAKDNRREIILLLTEFVFMTHGAFLTRHNDAFQMTRPKMRHYDAFL